MSNFKKNVKIATLYVKHFKRKYSFLVRSKTIIARSNLSSAMLKVQTNNSEEGSSTGIYSVPRFVFLHKKIIITSLIILIILFFASMMLYNKMVVYEYSYKGKVLGVVKDGNQVFEIVSEAEDQLSTPDGAEIVLDEKRGIKVKKIISLEYKDDDFDSGDDIIKNITTLKDIDVKGYNVIVNEKNLGTLISEEQGKVLLDRIKDYYLNGTDKNIYKRINFVENVSFELVKTKQNNIVSIDTIYNEITEGAIKLSTYQINKGETIFDIALMHDMKSERIEELNPAIDMELLQPGDILQVEVEQPLISLETVEVAEYEADVDYDIVYTDSDDLYKDEEKVLKEGKTGVRRVTADVTKINGVELDREELSSTITKKPVTKKVIKGTKARPAPISKGTYIWPAKARITSHFGERWGRLHRGLDIGVRYGAVVAADGGTITVAGNQNNSYGKAIKIDHGNGRATFYAHLSKIEVEVGQKVYQGQRIATSGNTGRSTGPHLHFEVHVNGIQRNPMNFLK